MGAEGSDGHVTQPIYPPFKINKMKILFKLSSFHMVPHALKTQTQRVEFSSSAVVQQRPDHRLYKRVDWTVVESGKYAIVDPLDPSNVLYLSPREYLTAQKTWISNDIAVVVLATPSDRPITPSQQSESKFSPKDRKTVPGMENEGQKAARGRLYGMFVSPLKRFINYFLESKRGPDITGCYQKLPQPVVEVNDSNIKDLILEWGSLLHFRLFGLATGRGHRLGLNGFASHAHAILRTQGALMLTKRMKLYALCLKAYLAGKPYKTTESLGIRIRLCHGLPKALPSVVRSALRTRSSVLYRLWISVLFAYKAFICGNSKPDIAAIVKSPPDYQSGMLEAFQKFQGKFKDLFKPVLLKADEPDFSSPALHWPSSSGPNVRPAPRGILTDLLAWVVYTSQHMGWGLQWRRAATIKLYLCEIVCRFEFLVSTTSGLELTTTRRGIPLTRFLEDFVFTRDSKLHVLLRASVQDLKKALGLSQWCVHSLEGPLTYTGPGEEPLLRTFQKGEVSKSLECHLVPKKHRPADVLVDLSSENDLQLARICFLKEPAGKVRNVALFDWWSQQLLKPVHDWLFSLLAFLPTDATFNQEGALKDFGKECGETDIFSYDLTAATENIGQSLYTIVLTEFWGRISARSWLDLMVNRWFQLTPMEGLRKEEQPKGPIKYRRGQPMGALSSWASMALVHHSIVQFAAYRVSLFPFWKYRVLGDDVVIAGRQVSESYLEVCHALGIPISLPKSLESEKGFFDFASQIMGPADNYSPISLREELAAQRPARRIEFGLRQARRGIIDMVRPTWFSAFLRFVLPMSVYTDIVEARAKGKLDPAVQVTLMSLLGTLDPTLKRVGFRAVARVPCWQYFLCITKGMLAFRKGLKAFLCLGKPSEIAEAKELAMEALVYRTKTLYRQFLALRPILQKMEEVDGAIRGDTVLGVRSILPSDLWYLATPLAHLWKISDLVTSFSEWTKEYRRPLKMIVVTGELRPMTVELFEFTIEMSLADAWDIVDRAERSLLVSPGHFLGEENEEAEIDILCPTTMELAGFFRPLQRSWGWKELLELAQSHQTPILGLPGPATAWQVLPDKPKP